MSFPTLYEAARQYGRLCIGPEWARIRQGLSIDGPVRPVLPDTTVGELLDAYGETLCEHPVIVVGDRVLYRMDFHPSEANRGGEPTEVHRDTALEFLCEASMKLHGDLYDDSVGTVHVQPQAVR
jgi:hypothetical protein